MERLEADGAFPMSEFRLGYRAKRADDRTGGPANVVAINPKLQHEFEEMMFSMIQGEYHDEGLTAVSQQVDGAFPMSEFRLGYRAKRADDRTGGPADVVAINPKLQHEFEEMMFSMIQGEGAQ